MYQESVFLAAYKKPSELLQGDACTSWGTWCGNTIVIIEMRSKLVNKPFAHFADTTCIYRPYKNYLLRDNPIDTAMEESYREWQLR